MRMWRRFRTRLHLWCNPLPARGWTSWWNRRRILPAHARAALGAAISYIVRGYTVRRATSLIFLSDVQSTYTVVSSTHRIHRHTLFRRHTTPSTGS
jgi:hypothetical protein